VHYDDAEDERFADTSEIATGLVADGSAYVVTVPQSVVDRAGGLKPLVERGQERFNIYCAPCHSKKGDGQGTVAKRGFPGVKNLGETSIREMTDGQLYATITRGKTTMPSYAAQVPVKDRWAIVAYVRALQLSLPPQETK
jgi:mono/diheme cytochrome c family protein